MPYSTDQTIDAIRLLAFILKGIIFLTVSQDVMGENYILIYFPSFIRNLNTHTITNTFGDVVFAIYRINAAEASEKKTITKGKN